MSTMFDTHAAFTATRPNSAKGLMSRIATALAARNDRALIRRQCRRLLNLEDHILSDIGMSRVEIHEVLLETYGH